MKSLIFPVIQGLKVYHRSTVLQRLQSDDGSYFNREVSIHQIINIIRLLD